MSDRLAALAPRYDLIIVGGGITGAGVLREAVRTGASVLLVEKSDFASGTSSASSKLVHGGLRYLQSGQWRLTLESVRERDRLLREAPGLIDPQPFLMPLHRGARPGRWLMQTGLFVYDLMAQRFASRWLSTADVAREEPALSREGLLGAVVFEDARTDDARLVQRLIEDSRALGATTLNYVEVEDLLRENNKVSGVALSDMGDGARRSIEAGLVVNATGVWARQFGTATVGGPALRPLRGSHFVFGRGQLPIRHAISWLHPQDRRPIFAYPWEGAVLYGTTDLDQDPRALDTVRMSAAESAYLIEALRLRFPGLALAASDALCSYAGVRPVVAGGKDSPSAESRDSALWSSPGLVSITGGKLTTFRVTARQVLAEAARQRPALAPKPAGPLFDTSAIKQDALVGGVLPRQGAANSAPVSIDERPVGVEPLLQGVGGIDPRLSGRLGPACAQRLLDEADPDALAAIGDTPYTWAELRWSARHEQVMHLEDLMLRRTRVGLVSREGGKEFLPRVRQTVQAALGWDDARWAVEEAMYLALWQRRHSPT